MNQYFPYLIVGGGMAADAAARGIRQVDPDRPIGMIGEEPDPPYNRPPLSKGLWKPVRPTPLSRIWRGTANLGVDLFLSRRVTRVLPDQKMVIDDRGETYGYEKLLLATGGTPIRLGPEHERIISFRTLEDYRRLRALSETCRHFLVIGGGFIGSEIAAALSTAGKNVTMIFPENGICARLLPDEVSRTLNDLFRQHDVRVLNHQLALTLLPDEKGVIVQTSGGDSLRADAVVTGLGIRPNTLLAETAGLQTANGIIVDEAMRTNHPDIFAAGDVANFFSRQLAQRLRTEHEENANLTGLLAGQAMAGQPGHYDVLPSVYSSLFDVHFDAVGDLDPSLEITYDWIEPFHKGVVFYLRSGRVRGVLLWGLGIDGLETARRMISSMEQVKSADLKGRISG